MKQIEDPAGGSGGQALCIQVRYFTAPPPNRSIFQSLKKTSVSNSFPPQKNTRTQDISSPTSSVWSQILDFNSYVGKVPKLKTCNTYATESEEDHKRLKVKMVIGVLPGYSYTCYYDHKFYPSKNSLTWSLDYEKYSDFDDVQGHWHVEDVGDRRCRVFYAADLKMRGKVPGPVMNILSKKALREATGWVKRESEKAAERMKEGPTVPGEAMPQN